MHDATDMDLLRQYAGGNSDAAFAALVSRHVNLVYSAALRKAGNPHAAEEITQAVFIILAQKAGRIPDKTILPGWLYQTARLTAASFLKREIRRVRREQEAFMLSQFDQPRSDLSRRSETEADETWQQLAPLLEDAMGQLGDKDRAVVVLRFFGGRSFAEVGTAAGVSENAAKKRLGHALEKLRKFFMKRGIASTAETIAGKISAHSVQAAPVALAKSVAAVAVAKGAAASTSTLTLIKGALKIMAWTSAKTAIVAGVAVILAVSTTTVVIKRAIQTRMDDSSIADSFYNPTNLWRAPSNVLILRQTHFTGQGSAMTAMRTRAGGKQEERILGRNQSIGQIFEMANGLAETETRMVLPADMPQFNFDYLITLPGSQEDQLKALQAVIKKKLGLVARFETLETNVLLLKLITPGVTGLKPHPANGNAGVTVTAGQIHAVGQSTAYLTTTLEYAFKLPILDQTGLDGKRYDYVLDEGFFDGTTESEKVKEFVRDEFGLELVPTNMPIKMLVVEKAK
jgi:uncharacterized protein (TIGR03435 family)